MGHQCRLRFHERIGPAFDDAALDIDSELRSLGIEHGFDELTFPPFADLESQPKQMNIGKCQ